MGVSQEPALARPRRIDSLVRTFTAAVIAVGLVGTVIYLSVVNEPGDRLTGLQAVVVGWAGVIVGFYFGGHVAQNTASLEEARQTRATEASEASAVRSEAAAAERQTP